MRAAEVHAQDGAAAGVEADAGGGLADAAGVAAFLDEEAGIDELLDALGGGGSAHARGAGDARAGHLADGAERIEDDEEVEFLHVLGAGVARGRGQHRAAHDVAGAFGGGRVNRPGWPLAAASGRVLGFGGVSVICSSSGDRELSRTASPMKFAPNTARKMAPPEAIEIHGARSRKREPSLTMEPQLAWAAARRARGSSGWSPGGWRRPRARTQSR